MNIEFCGRDKIESVMRFFGEHWAPNHILSKNRSLVDWQHYDRHLDRYNFVIAVDDSGAVVGTLGFIPTSHFDHRLRGNDTIWLTSWKVHESRAPTGLGLRLHSFLERNVPHSMVGTVGNNEHAGKIYKALGYTTGSMEQFYMLNSDKSSFKLCEVSECPQREIEVRCEPKNLIRLDSRSLRELSPELAHVADDGLLPLKSAEYFVNRFLSHPVYDYSVYAVLDDEQPRGFLALRCAEAKGQRAIRVVDYYGDVEAVSTLQADWQNLLQECDAEYIDMYCHGPLSDPLRASGMTRLDPAGNVIIPNHFEPFVKKNVVIHWAYKGAPGIRHLVLKADADQDRPNLVQPQGAAGDR